MTMLWISGRAIFGDFIIGSVECSIKKNGFRILITPYCSTFVQVRAVGKLASLNCSWQSEEGTFRALGMAGIEPTPSSQKTKPCFRLSQLSEGEW